MMRGHVLTRIWNHVLTNHVLQCLHSGRFSGRTWLLWPGFKFVTWRARWVPGSKNVHVTIPWGRNSWVMEFYFWLFVWIHTQTFIQLGSSSGMTHTVNFVQISNSQIPPSWTFPAQMNLSFHQLQNYLGRFAWLIHCSKIEDLNLNYPLTFRCFELSRKIDALWSKDKTK
jgi:hypothetical protein